MLARLSNWRSGHSSGTKGRIFQRGATYRILWTFGLDPAGGIVCRFRACPNAETAMQSTLPGAWTPVLQNGKTYPFSAQSLRALQELNAAHAAEIASIEAAAAEAAATGAPVGADVSGGPVVGFPTATTAPLGAVPISIFDKRLRVAPWNTRAYKAVFVMYWTFVSFTLFCLYWVVKQRLLNVKAREVVSSLEKVGSSIVVGGLVAPVTFVAPASVSERCRHTVEGAVRSVAGAFFAGAERLGCYNANKQERDDARMAERREARARARAAGGSADAAASAAKSNQPQEWLEAGGARLLLSVAICLLLGYTVF